MSIIPVLIIIILFFLIVALKEVKQYERGVVFMMGKYGGTKEPGWRIVIPLFQRMAKVDMRVRAVDVPNQDAITKDNVSAQINAVIYYKVINAAKAIIEVEDYRYAISQIAQTTMRNVVGEVDLDSLLSERDEISARIQAIVDKLTEPWGIQVNSVDLKDIVLPEQMRRTIGKQAEAERERRAVIINSEGEVAAAANIAKAAGILTESPGALHLRTLQSINDISSDESNTIVFAVPLEVLRAFDRLGKKEK